MARAGRAADGPSRSIRRYVPATLLMPFVGASLGIDGGPIFQILAVENLGLSANAIGLAFGLGVASLPLQLYAARLPIERARRNVQVFLAIAAAQAWVLAILVAIGATGGLASMALGVTVTAEIALSVLFATAWQPLLADGVGTHGRQRLSSRWSAIARGGLVVGVLVFAALGSGGRSVFLAAVGVLAIAVAVGLDAVADPTPPPDDSETAASTRSLAPATRVLLCVLATVNVGALPLWLVYLNKVLWPSVNLGAVAAVQTGASVAALVAWRSTARDVSGRALAAAVAALAAAASLALLDGPVGTDAQAVIVIAATAIMAGSASFVRVAMLESAHRIVTPATTVRAFTMLDVVASTSLQAGLLVSGLLITASASPGGGVVDPYRAFVLVASALTIPVIIWFRSASMSAGSARS